MPIEWCSWATSTTEYEAIGAFMVIMDVTDVSAALECDVIHFLCRSIVDNLLGLQMHEVLLNNDQLRSADVN